MHYHSRFNSYLTNNVYNITIIIYSCLLLLGCNKNEMAWNLKKERVILEIQPINVTEDVFSRKFIIQVNLVDAGTLPIQEKGIVVATHELPTVTDTRFSASSGNGNFEVSAIGLQSSTFYHVRAYARNEAGVWYSAEEKVLTIASAGTPADPDIPFVTTQASPSAAVLEGGGTYRITLGGAVVSDRGAQLTQQGVCVATHPDATVNDISVNSSGVATPFTVSVTGLTANTTYYYRAFAQNSVGIGYGSEYSFVPGVTSLTPEIQTGTLISQMSSFTARVTLTLVDNHGSALIAKGFCWDTLPNPDVSKRVTDGGAGVSLFTATLEGLIPGKTYFVRGYGTNANGTGYGNEVSFVANTPSTITYYEPFNNLSAWTASGFTIVADTACFQANCSTLSVAGSNASMQRTFSLTSIEDYCLNVRIQGTATLEVLENGSVKSSAVNTGIYFLTGLMGSGNTTVQIRVTASSGARVWVDEFYFY